MDNFREEVRGVLVDIYRTGYSRKNGEQQASDYIKERIEAIHALYKKKWLEMIGEYEGLLPAKDFNDERLTSQDYALLTENRLGYNRAKAELRKGVEG